jgi:hypothetical protein
MPLIHPQPAQTDLPVPLPRLLDLFMRLVLPAIPAVFIFLDPIGIVLFILRGRVVPLLADRTRHRNNVPHV